MLGYTLNSGGGVGLCVCVSVFACFVFKEMRLWVEETHKMKEEMERALS